MKINRYNNYEEAALQDMSILGEKVVRNLVTILHELCKRKSTIGMISNEWKLRANFRTVLIIYSYIKKIRPKNEKIKWIEKRFRALFLTSNTIRAKNIRIK